MVEEPIRLEKPKTVLKVLQLFNAGLKDDEIGKKLHMSSSAVFRMRKRFERVYPRLLEFVRQIEKNKLFDKGYLSLFANERVFRRAQQGLFLGVVPFGYKSVDGKLVVVPEEAEVVRQIFNLYSEGKTMNQIAEKIGKTRRFVNCILRNPVYKGMIRWKSNLYPGKHEAIVSEELWDSVQPELNTRVPPRPPFGFMRKAGRLVVNPQEADKVREAFRLYLEGVYPIDIWKRLKIPRNALRYMFKDPRYIEIVGRPVWEKSQNVHLPSGKERLKKIAHDRMLKARNAILAAIPGTVTEIAAKTGLKRSTLYRHLSRLQEEGILQKRGVFGAYYLTEEFAKSIGKEVHYSIWDEISPTRSKYLKRIIQALPGNLSELHQATGLSKDEIKSWLLKLAKKGIIEKRPPMKGGKYYITNKFKNEIETNTIS